MGILDEIGDQAASTEGMLKQEAAASREAEILRRLKKGCPAFTAFAFIGVLIPYIGWGITLSIFLFFATVPSSLNPRKAGSEAFTLGVFYAFFLFFASWLAGVIVGDSGLRDGMLFGLGVAILCAIGQARNCWNIRKWERTAQKTVEFIASQKEI